MRVKYVKYKDSIGYRAINRLKTIRSNVLLREDFEDLGSYRQISRTIKKLIREKKLVRIGTGLYAKTYISKFSDTPLIKNGVDSTLREALRRLGIEFEAGSAEKEYNEGKTTQIPIGNVVRLKSRCRRQIEYGNSKLIFEKNINAM